MRCLSSLEIPALLAIILSGLALRLYGLTSYNIWFDEGYHLQLVRLPTVALMLEAVLANLPSDPLYVLLLRLWTWLFGTGDAAARLFSVLLSTAILPAVYWLGRVLASRPVGLLAALLLALSPYAVEFGQEVALYVLASLATTAALAAGWQFYRSGRGAPVYTILGIIAIYSHYVVAAILLLFAALAFLPLAGQRGALLRTWLLAHAAIFVAWLPWLLALIYNWANSSAPRATLPHPATISEVLGALVQFSSGTAALLGGNRPLQLSGLVVGGLLLLVGVLAGKDAARRGLLVVAVLFATIFLLPATISALTGLWLFVPHFMLFLLPALFVVLAAGFLYLLDLKRPVVAALLLVVWLGVQVGGLALFYVQPPHGDDGLRELAAVLSSAARPDDLVFVTPPALSATLAHYYSGPIYGLPSDFDLRTVYIPYEPTDWNARSLEALQRKAALVDRFWLVYRPELDAGGGFLAEVRQQWTQESYQTYQFADLYLFSK